MSSSDDVLKQRVAYVYESNNCSSEETALEQSTVGTNGAEETPLAQGPRIPSRPAKKSASMGLTTESTAFSPVSSEDSIAIDSIIDPTIVNTAQSDIPRIPVRPVKKRSTDRSAQPEDIPTTLLVESTVDIEETTTDTPQIPKRPSRPNNKVGPEAEVKVEENVSKVKESKTPEIAAKNDPDNEHKGSYKSLKSWEEKKGVDEPTVSSEGNLAVTRSAHEYHAEENIIPPEEGTIMPSRQVRSASSRLDASRESIKNVETDDTRESDTSSIEAPVAPSASEAIAGVKEPVVPKRPIRPQISSPKTDSPMPTVPQRPSSKGPKATDETASRPIANVRSAEISSSTPTESKRPSPPVPKKPSSKIAAFQELLRKNQSESQQDQTPIFPRRTTSPPKRTTTTASTGEDKIERSATSDKAFFKQNLNKIFALPGMTPPVDSVPGRLDKVSSYNNEDTVDSNSELQADTGSDLRMARVRGPRGKRLPKSVTQEVKRDDKREIKEVDVWQVGIFSTDATKNAKKVQTVLKATDSSEVLKGKSSASEEPAMNDTEVLENQVNVSSPVISVKTLESETSSVEGSTTLEEADNLERTIKMNIQSEEPSERSEHAAFDSLKTEDEEQMKKLEAASERQGTAMVDSEGKGSTMELCLEDENRDTNIGVDEGTDIKGSVRIHDSDGDEQCASDEGNLVSEVETDQQLAEQEFKGA